MRFTQVCCILLFTFFIATPGFSQIPQVPSSIEIAEVKLKITAGARAKIQKDINAIRASEKYFRIKLDLVNLYFPIIERVLKEEGVPDDMKYLSIQESALKSDAVSSANAVGYWQFKDFTAREVGLRVDSKVDERKNIVSATRGAAKYLIRNNTFFDNWIYAINAYMTGPGGAKRYVEKTNFGTGKMTITEDTHWYVIRFIAHVIAYKDEVGGPHSQGLKLVEYIKGANKDLDQIARQFNVDRELVKEYNKWLSHGKVPDDKTYTVIIPITGEMPELETINPPLARKIKEPDPAKYPDKLTEDIGSDKAILVKINGIEAVMAGENDNVVSLALKAGISSKRLIKFNDLDPGQQIESGEIYYTQRKKNRSPIRYHVAQYNESLWDISQKYGVKLKKIAKKNRMEMDGPVKPGQVIWLRKKRPRKTPVEYHKVKKPEPQIIKKEPVVKEPEPQITIPVAQELPVEKKVEQVKEPVKTEEKKSAPEPVLVYKYHEVTAGESLWKIAKKYQVSIEEIRKWNELSTTSTLSPGQKLRLRTDRISEIAVPEEEVKTEAPKAKEEYHIVNGGESLWSIAKKYDVTIEQLTNWNGLKENASLSIGQKLALNESVSKPQDEVKEIKTSTHIVQRGESLWSISKKYNVTIEQLTAWNGLGKNASLSIGQKLSLKEGESKKAEPQYVTYIVRGGDSLYKIAREHNTTIEEIMSLNNLTSSSLSVGDELKVKRQ